MKPTLGQIADALPSLVPVVSTRKQYLSCLKRLAKLMNEPMERAEAPSLEEFERLFPMTGFDPQLYGSQSAYRQFRSKTRAALMAYDRAYGVGRRSRAHDRVSEEWTVAQERIKAALRRCGYSDKKQIAFGCLAKAASERDCAPQAISLTRVQRWGGAFTAAQLRTSCDALKVLAELIEREPDLGDVFPKASEPDRTRTPRIPEALNQEIETWVTEHCRGVYDVATESHEFPARPGTMTKYRDSLRLIVKTYLEIDTARRDIDLLGILDANNTKKIIHHYNMTRPEGAGGSMAMAMKQARTIAKRRDHNVDHIKNQLKANRKMMEATKRSNEMCPEARRFCTWLVRDASAGRRFRRLDKDLMTKAKALEGRVMSGDATSKEVTEFRHYGSIAAMITVLLWVSPLRIGNLLNLRLYGPNPHIWIQRTGQKSIKLYIHGRDVKNWKDADPPLAFNTRGEVDRLIYYIDKVRPLVPTHAASNLLFPGFVDPSAPLTHNGVERNMRERTGEVGFYRMRPHLFRHGVASLMLAKDPSAVREVATRLGITVAMVNSHYGFIDEKKMSERAQDLWLDDDDEKDR